MMRCVGLGVILSFLVVLPFSVGVSAMDTSEGDRECNTSADGEVTTGVDFDGDGKITENVRTGDANDIVTEEVTFVVEEMEIA